jgi:hypothetical protein
MGLLAAEAADDTDSSERLQAVMESRLLTLLNNQDSDSAAQPMDPLRRPPHAELPRSVPDLVLEAGKRHAFALRVVSGLTPKLLKPQLDDADDSLSHIDSEQLARLGIAPETTGSLRRLVIYGGPCYETGDGDEFTTLHLYIEDLASMAQDALDSEVGRDLLFEFLDEATAIAGTTKLMWLDFLDVWRHWKRFGVLNPTGSTGVALVVDPTPDDVAWEASAKREPFEAVLADAGLPPMSDWKGAVLDEPGRATLWGPDRAVYLIATKPRLAVATRLDDALSTLHLDPAFAVGVADGLVLTCLRSPELAAGLTMPDGRTLTLSVTLTVDRPPGLDQYHPSAIGVWASPAPRPMISLLLGPDWLELLASEPRNAHLALGAALLYCTEKAAGRRPPKDKRRIHRNFLTAWASAPPVALLHVTEASLSYRNRGPVGLPRSHATRARAERLLAQAVLKRGVAPGLFNGDAALAVCRDQILPALESLLTQVITTWTMGAIPVVAEHLNDAYAERLRAGGELGRALTTPWAATWRAVALEGDDGPFKTRPLELLLESALATCPGGAITPDRFDVAEAADLAQLTMEIGTGQAGYERRLNSLSVIVSALGTTQVHTGPTSLADTNEPMVEAPYGRLDVPRYLAFSRADSIRAHPGVNEPRETATPAQLPPDWETRESPFQRLRDAEGVPGRLLAADQAMRTACGTGLDGLGAVLGTALTWRSGNEHVTVVPREELRAAALDWSNLPPEEVEAALQLLVLRPDALRAEDIPHWEQERRSHRLAIQPIPQIGDDLIVMPWAVASAQGIFLSYLADGRLPWHPSSLPDAVRNAFGEYRQIANFELERDATELVRSVPLPCRSHIEPHTAAASGLRLNGEVDLLVADPLHHRLWVCEVKDVAFAVSPRTIRGRIDHFVRRDGHIAQLMSRWTEISANPQAAVGLLAGPLPTLPWQVLPLMITRRVEPAAFVDGIAVTFTVLDDLTTVLQTESDPQPGHSPIGMTAR